MKRIFAVILMALTLVACSSNSKEVAKETTESANKNNKTASAEQDEKDVKGTITLYTSQPEEDAKKLIDGFKKVHPEVDVVVFRSGTEELVSKILSEKEVNALQADVVLVADTVTFEILKSKDILEQYASPELKGIDKKFYDEENYYAGTKIISTGIIQNTDVYKGEVKGFNDLIKEETKSQTIMTSLYILEQLLITYHF